MDFELKKPFAQSSFSVYQSPPGAPPPYQPYISTTDSYQSNMPGDSNSISGVHHVGAVRRRSSWSELTDLSNEGKLASLNPNSSYISVIGKQNALPLKSDNAPMGSHPSLCSATSKDTTAAPAIYVNNKNSHLHKNIRNYSNGDSAACHFGQDAYSIPVKFGADSRQTSISSSSGVISDFFTFAKGSPCYQKFTETGVHFSPIPAGQMLGSSAIGGGGSSSIGSTNISAAQPMVSGFIPPQSTATYRKRIEETVQNDSTGRIGVSGSSAPHSSSGSASRRQKRDRMEELRQCCRKTPSRVTLCALILVFLVAIIITIILYQLLHLPTHLQFTWLAPELLRAGQPTPNKLQMDVVGQQIRFELAGSMPFKSNFVSVLDFKTNKVAIVDSSLRAGSKNLVCFVMELDRTAITDMSSLQRAASNSAGRTTQHLGWQETWNFLPVPIFASSSTLSKLFQPDVVECRGARWIELRSVNTNQKPMHCSECYDFCLPEYGIEKDYIRDESFLNIVRRDCFYLFVPEWRSYAQAYSNQQNQQDFENYYRHNGHYHQSNQQMGRSGNLQPNQPLDQQHYSSNNNGDNRSLGQNVVGVLNQAGREFGEVLANTIAPGIQQGGQRVGEIVGGLQSNLQNVGDQVGSKWIELSNMPEKIANVSSNAWNTLQGGANYFKQQLFNGDNQNNQGNNHYNRNNNNNNGNDRSHFPSSGFDFAESQFSRYDNNPQQSDGNKGYAGNNYINRNVNGNYQAIGGYGSGSYSIGGESRNNGRDKLAPGNTQFSGNNGIPQIAETFNGRQSDINRINHQNLGRYVPESNVQQQSPQRQSLQQLLQQTDTQAQTLQQQQMGIGQDNLFGSSRYDTGPNFNAFDPQKQRFGNYGSDSSASMNNRQQPQRLSQLFEEQQLSKNNNNNYDNTFGMDLSNQHHTIGASGQNFGADLSQRPSNNNK